MPASAGSSPSTGTSAGHTNDYSLHADLVGRRVEVRASQREITATKRDSGELVCRHERSFAKNRTITALDQGTLAWGWAMRRSALLPKSTLFTRPRFQQAAVREAIFESAHHPCWRTRYAAVAVISSPART